MVELRAGRLRCELVPELGGCIAGLWLDDAPVLRSTPAAQLTSARLAGCYPLVPFSNRIGHASIVWEGTQLPMVRFQGDPPHTIRGVGWQRGWSLLDQDATSAMLSYEHRADASWPFAFDCSHTLRLTETTLEMTLALTNQASEPAPVGLGWQPSFVKRAGSHLALRASDRWALGPERWPTVRVRCSGIDADCAALALDDCYDGWDGVAQLRDERLRVTLRSGLTHLVVWTEPASDAIAIEPVSHAANAVHLYAQGASAADLGLSLLQPGETLVAQFAIEAEPAA
jgi:aldose 1-epimerase